MNIKTKGIDGYANVTYVFLRKTQKRKTLSYNTEEQMVIL